VTYNINGTRGSLAAILAQAKLARIDILILQELHFYESGEHLEIRAITERLGWMLVYSPATRNDPSSGVAIAVRQDSKGVTPLIESARSIIPSRYITMTCTTNGTKQEFSSAYLSAQAPLRKTHLNTIAKSKILKEHGIAGGDFNCVESTELDVRYPVGENMTYAHASGTEVSRLVAECRMIDAFRLMYGDIKEGYSRLAHTVHTRIDRIYTKAYDTEWRWHKLSTPPPPTYSQATPNPTTFQWLPK
jgi:exonuclease III